jgi:hypothetical protein
VQAPVLLPVDPERSFVLRTDASEQAMGAVLYQEHEDGLHPVEFRSKRLAPHQQRYAAHVREFLAVLYALKQYRCYLQG